MKRLIALVPAACLLWGVAPAHEGSPTLERIRESGTLTIGYRDDSPPFSFVDDSGSPAGFSVDLCKRVAAGVEAVLGREIDIEYVPVTADDRFDAVVSGKIDIECGSTTNTLSRQEKVDFTHITFVTGGTILTKKDSGVKGPSDLGGRSVAVMRGTTTETALTRFLNAGLIEANVRRVASHKQGMQMLDAGDVHAFASDRVVLIGQLLKAKDRNAYALSEDFFSYEPYGLMVPRNDADFRLVANRALSRVYGTGQIGILYKKWFGELSARPSALLMAVYQIQALPQ